MVLESPQELESPAEARDESVRVGRAQEIAVLDDDVIENAIYSNPHQSHFMLRQQQMANMNAHDGDRSTCR